MDLEKIREFAAFSRTLKFTEAARELHMSQSSLSKHIRDLEDEVGAVLVQRGANGGHNALTTVGRRFLELTGPWLAEYDVILAECRELNSAEPPARIQNMRCSLNINSQLRSALAAKGTAIGNFSYVDIVDQPICDALDQGVLDFAVHCEAEPCIRLPVAAERAGAYGWIALAPEPLCFLAGAGNPLATGPAVSLADVERSRIITIENAAHCNWQETCARLFGAQGCTLSFRVVRDSPTAGGAFPVGAADLVLCTRRFARYYQELDVEDVHVLAAEGFEPTVYPFLVYRKDTASAVARQVIAAMG